MKKLSEEEERVRNDMISEKVSIRDSGEKGKRYEKKNIMRENEEWRNEVFQS